MKNDPLALLVRRITPEEKAREREFWEAKRAEREKRKKQRVARIPTHLATLWCEWNRKCEGAAEQLAYEFGKYFKSETLAEWNKPISEELEAMKMRKKQARRARYNEYMRGYLRSYRDKKRNA